MKQTVKLAIRYIFSGISIGCTSFVIMCLSYFIGGGEEILALICKDFARQSLGAMIVGIACGGTAVIYQFGRPGAWVKAAIHFCVGMGVFYPVAIYLGWIPFHPDRIGYTVLQFLASCGIFMLIWLGFYLFNRNEARQINERLRELEQGREHTEAEAKSFQGF